METCPICGSPLINDFKMPEEYIWEYYCYRCGKFKILKTGMHELNQQKYNGKFNNVIIVNISGWIRENQGSDIILDKEKFKSLISLPELSMFEKADKMLLYLANKFPIAGMNLDYEFNDAHTILDMVEKKTFPNNTDQYAHKTHKNAINLLSLIAIGRIINGSEFSFIFSRYIKYTKGYITEESPKITPEGWEYLETFRHPNPDSKKAFIAMWFDEEMEEIYDNYISKAIEEAGYKPIQIGRKEHNNDINDEIIGEIRSCKFIVADLTGNRGGVYYEAGFAQGLNLEVINTCREDHLKDVHFDINHRNIIKWKDGNELYEKLLNRIKATIV